MSRIILLLASVLVMTFNCWGQGVAANAPNTKLETPYFYFDNPDGTIEIYPEYTIEGMDDRVMSISSSKYANPLKNVPESDFEKEWIMLFFGRKTRTTVFVFDGQESAKAGMMTATVYTGTLIGCWGALWEGMRDKVSLALDDANIDHMKRGSYKDYITQEPPEELEFNGHEGGHIVWRMDMSDSWISLVAAANIELVFDLYTYYDKEYNKIVCVLFTYSELKDPVSRSDAIAAGVMKVISAATGYYDEETGNTTMANMFEHKDMIDYFKQHFHLKKADKSCVAEYINSPTGPKLQLCEDTIDIKFKQLPPIIYEDPIRIDPRTGQPPVPRKPRDGKPQDKPNKKPGNINNILCVVQQEESVERPLEEDNNNVYMLQASYGSKNGVIAVEKATGNMFEAVPVKTKKDHPTIYSIGAHGNDLYLDVDDIGIIRYDGKSIESSDVLVSDPDFKPGWTGARFKRIIFSPNGRYMAYVGERAKVYDLQDNNKCIKYTHECGAASQVLTDDGDLFSVDAYRILVARNNGNKDEGVTSEANVSEITGGAPCNLHILGNEVYITGGKKLLKTDANKFEWTLVSTMPGSEGYKISGLSANGTGFAVTDAGGNFYVHASFNNQGSTPVLMKKIVTGLKNQFNEEIDTHNVTSVHFDNDGNVWLQYSDAGYVVYNSLGLVGLTQIAGKFKLYKE